MNPTGWAILIVAWLAAAGWIALAVRLALMFRTERPQPLATEPAPADAPAVDAIVAARDEEAGIEASVSSLLAQEYPRLTITVVDDQSTDRTGALLDAMAMRPEAAGRLRVIHGVERPEGWVGKTWAVEQGRDGASADWLWFVDADIVLHPRALATAMREAERRGADLVSLVPGGHPETFWQRVIALVLGQMLVQLFPPDQVNDPGRPGVALAAGGFLLIRRATYEAVGGHAAVRREIVEDVRLARLVKEAGGRLFVAGAPEVATTHLYGDLRAIWRGLIKNAFALMNYRLPVYLAAVVIWLTMAWAPPIALAWGLAARGSPAAWPLIVAGLSGCLAQALVSLPFLLVLRIGPWYAITQPLGITLYLLIITASVWHHLRGRVLWKGRAYDAKALAGRGHR